MGTIHETARSSSAGNGNGVDDSRANAGWDFPAGLRKDPRLATRPCGGREEGRDAKIAARHSCSIIIRGICVLRVLVQKYDYEYVILSTTSSKVI